LDRGVSSSRASIGEFELRGRAVVIATGGIGGNVEAIKKNWPLDRLGPSAPKNVVCGVPAHVDGKMVQIAEQQGANVINMDRMWHYTEGLQNWNSIWPLHGIRIIPGPSSLWLDANGDRLPGFLIPGNDTLATLRHICSTGHDYSFFVLNRSIIAREFALSGSEQNEDITSKSYYKAAYRYFTRWGTKEVQAFLKNGEDFVQADNLPELVEGMNRLAAERNGPRLSLDSVQRQIEARDAQVDNIYTKDAQVMMIKNTRGTRADALRVTPPHKLLDKSAGPLIAVRLNILTRKSLGGLQTNLDSQVLRPDGTVFNGLYAAGEAAGFGGGGVHGYSVSFSSDTSYLLGGSLLTSHCLTVTRRHLLGRLYLHWASCWPSPGRKTVTIVNTCSVGNEQTSMNNATSYIFMLDSG
jgi:predicted oxidoreductase